MLNERQQRIIKYLEQRADYQKGSKLALLFGVSERTIRSDVETINYELPQKIVGTLHGYGIGREGQGAKAADTSNIPQNSKERQKQILLRLLYGEKRLNITALMNTYHISESVLMQDLAQLRKLVSVESLAIVRKNNCIAFDGEEVNKRRIFKQMLLRESNSGIVEIDWLNEMFDGYDVHDLMEKFDELCEQYDYVLNAMAYQLLVIHIVIALERIKKGYYMHSLPMEVKEEQKEYQLSSAFFSYIQKMLQCSIPKQEVDSFSRLLIGNRLRIHRDIDDSYISNICLESVNELSQYFLIDFYLDEELMIGLSIHLEYMLYRMNHQIEVQNELLNEIKLSMPLVFELSIHLGTILSRNLKVIMNDSELGFLALHLGAALSRIEAENRYRVVLINPFKNKLGMMFKEKIKQQFVEEIEIVAEIAYLNKNRLQYYRPDFVISPLSCDSISNGIQVKLDMDYRDFGKISQFMQTLAQQKAVRELLGLSSGVFQESLFFKGLKKASVDDVICFLSNCLYENKIVGEDFYESVMEREQLSSTSFEQFFAVPHAMKLNAQETKVAVAILEKPIVWGKFLVKVVMLFAIKKEDRGHLGALYHLISDVLTTPQLFDQIVHCQSFHEFQDFLMNVKEE